MQWWPAVRCGRSVVRCMQLQCCVMRRLVSLLSLSALLAGLTPFTPCPVARARDTPAAAPAAAEARHHHHASAATRAAGSASVTMPGSRDYGGSCSMLTRCELVAVASEPIGSEPLS